VRSAVLVLLAAVATVAAAWMLLASVACWLFLKAPIQYVLVDQGVIADQGSGNKGAFSLRAQAAQWLLRSAALAHGPSVRRCALAVSLLP
jgi:hypothetical protein